MSINWDLIEQNSDKQLFSSNPNISWDIINPSRGLIRNLSINPFTFMHEKYFKYKILIQVNLKFLFFTIPMNLYISHATNNLRKYRFHFVQDISIFLSDWWLSLELYFEKEILSLTNLAHPVLESHHLL